MEEERKSTAKKIKNLIQLGKGTSLKRKPDWEDNKQRNQLEISSKYMLGITWLHDFTQIFSTYR